MIKRYNFPVILAQIAIIAIYSIVVFALGAKENLGNASFIVSYIFIYLATALGQGLIYLVERKKSHDQSINDIMLFVPANVVAFLAYLGVSILFYFAKASTVTLLLVIDLSFLILYVAYGLFVWFVKVKQTEEKEHVRKKVNFIRVLEEELLSAADKIDDAETKEIVTSLARDVRFSDPMSDISLAALEDDIYALSGKIAEFAKAKQFDLVKQEAQNLANLLKERNRKCKILK